MIEEIFTVYDSAAKRYLQPFFAPTLEVAIRMFRELANKPEHQFGKYPSDYELRHIGSFDGETGTVTPADPTHSLGVALTYVNRLEVI